MRAATSSADIVFMNSWSIDTIYNRKQLLKDNDEVFFNDLNFSVYVTHWMIEN